MSSSATKAATRTAAANLPTVSEFLKSLQEQQQQDQQQQPPITSVSLGNPAGDADSIISAIALAYIDSVPAQSSPKTVLPIISIPHDDLKRQRPETKYLLELAGIDMDDLVAIDSPSLPCKASATLVDHNRLTFQHPDSKCQWEVTQILDHHLDEGAHLETCPASTNEEQQDQEQRVVAFCSSSQKALVASTCTLLVERFLARHSGQPFPPSLSILLLGVILLDSINMSPKAGKGTERDRLALEQLQQQTNWESLDLPLEILMKEASSKKQPNHQQLFDTLQNQKFHPDFWNSLTALQALKLDYKRFTPTGVNNNNNSINFGVSTVLQTMSDFVHKEGLLDTIQSNYGSSSDLEFFAVMFFSVDGDDTPKRQMMLASENVDLVNDLITFLMQEGSLQLQQVEETFPKGTNDMSLNVVYLEQGNARASRKQVAPILMDYFKDTKSEL